MQRKIVMEKPDLTQKNHSQLLCPGSIPGASVYHHSLEAGSSLEFAPNVGYWHILMLLEGAAAFKTDGKEYDFSKRTIFVPALEQALGVTAQTDARFLEVQWKVAPEDLEELKGFDVKFPIVQDYALALQYRDPFKTEKTISRALIEQRNIPRFAIGSVESFGYDIVNPHAHPPLDQFFYSFTECDMDVLIDGESVPMGGDLLMHIPLGSDHGAEVFDNKHMHYLWIDFIQGEEGLKMLDEGHKATGRMDSF